MSRWFAQQGWKWCQGSVVWTDGGLDLGVTML